MSKSHAATVNYPSGSYRSLSKYVGIMPGMVGTATSNGRLVSIPVPAFAPFMGEQTVPSYNVSYIGTPSDLMHGLSADQLTSGYFPVTNAYPSKCTTFTKRACDAPEISEVQAAQGSRGRAGGH